MAVKKKTKKPVVKAKKAPARMSAPKPTKRKGTVNHPALDNADHEEVLEIFRVYDRDGSGTIDRGEFTRLLEALGMSPGEEELSIALGVVDANRSGKISWDEFKAWWTNR